MLDKDLNKFLTYLLEEYFVFAPQISGGKLKIVELKDSKNIDWSAKVPENSWKALFLPHQERLFDLENNQLKKTAGQQPEIAALGMNVLDLKALTLFDQVFSNDVYYQDRRKNVLVVGYASEWPIDYKRYKVFSHEFEEDVLEHVAFDVFIVRLKNNVIKFYTGSKIGQNILNGLKIKKFDHVEFAGGTPESGPAPRLLELEKRVSLSAKRQLWEKLNDQCLACGKCSIVCPTCFCFDFEDKIDPQLSRRNRKWGVCFYNDFSKVAGGFKFLDTVKQKIYFWYVHKFVRIPHEYKLPGCVSCNRCSQVCPVGINITKNIAEIMKMKFDKPVKP